jgi:hypothetical protein
VCPGRQALEEGIVSEIEKAGRWPEPIGSVGRKVAHALFDAAQVGVDLVFPRSVLGLILVFQGGIVVVQKMAVAIVDPDAHLGAQARIARHQGRLGEGLVQVLVDDGAFVDLHPIVHQGPCTRAGTFP